MKRLMLDSNIYGEMVIDPEIESLKEAFARKKIIVYGSRLVRKELRQTPKEERISEGSLRMLLLKLYDEVVKNHEYEITKEMKSIAENYYKAYREFGGSKSREEIIDDFIIIACATVHNLDIVVSEDEKSMLTENAIRAYNLINSTLEKRTPEFIGYEKFKAVLRSSGLDKFSGGADKLGILLPFLNLLPYVFLRFHKITFNKTNASKYLKLPLLAFSLILFSASFAFAAVPNVMNFQSKLTDPSNVLLTDTYNFTFRVFNVASGGTNLWNEQQRLRVDQGIVNAILGNNTALNLSFNETYYLEIQIGSETLTPRHRVATSGYAFRANTSEDLVCTSCVESGDIASNAVTSAKIAGGAVTSAKLASDLTLEGNLNAASGLFYLDNATRRVGINDTTPDGIFDIDVSGAANLLVVNATTGNTGFGTASPIMTLDIRGDINATGLLNISRIVIWGASANLTEWRNAAGTPIASVNSTGGAELRGGLRLTTLTSCDTIDTDASGNFRCGSDSGSAGSTGWSVSSLLVYNDTTGVNVSIGTQTVPAGYIFAVAGSINITGNINGTFVGTLAANTVTTTSIADNAITTSKIANGAITSAKLAADLTLEGNLNAGSGMLFIDNSTRRVGINDTSPDGIFDIDTSPIANALVVNATTGNVGLSTTSPSYRLHIISDDTTNQSVMDILTLEHTTTAISNGTNGIGVGLLFRAEDTARDIENVTLIQGILTTATNTSEASALTFWTRTGGLTLSEKLRISGDGVVDINGTLRSNGTTLLATTGGNVGVGTLSPITTLDVRGNINATGFVNTTTLQLVTGGTLLFPNDIITSAMINTLATTELTGIVSDSNLPANYASFNETNTWTSTQFFAYVNVSTVLNATNITLPVLGACSTSLETNSIGQIVCGTDPTVVTSLNALTGAINIRGSAMINVTGNASSEIVLSFNNISLSNLDTRQRADNASVARTNVENTFSANQFITGGLNATTFVNATTLNITLLANFQGNVTIYGTNRNDTNLVFRNVLPSPNTTQERWLDTNGRVVAMRYWNGTSLVLNVSS